MMKDISDLELKIKIDNTPIRKIQKCKGLGVTIDQHSFWDSNTDNICKI